MPKYDYTSLNSSYFDNQNMWFTFTPGGTVPPTTVSMKPTNSGYSASFDLDVGSTCKFLNIEWKSNGITDSSAFTGYSFKFDFRLNLNFNPSYKFDQSFMKITFNDGSIFTVSGQEYKGSNGRIIQFSSDYLNFASTVQVSDIQCSVPVNFYSQAFTANFTPTLLVSHTYNPNADIIEEGENDPEINRIDGKADQQQSAVNGLVHNDKTPKYEYQSVDIDLEQYAMVKEAYGGILGDSFVSKLLIPALALALVSYLLFGRGG